MSWMLRAVGVFVMLAAWALSAAPALAVTCEDYPNQAAAQRAADTRDADGDGIYCEALPCPCARGGTTGSPSRDGTPTPRRRAQVIHARVTDVVDGDTLKVRAFRAKRRLYTVRILGIDAPETRKPGTPVECGGREAVSAMWGLNFSGAVDTDGDGLADSATGPGQPVTLTTDPTQDLFDRFGRLLAYTRTPTGRDVGRRLIFAGWAKTSVFDRRPFKRVRLYRRAERRAKLRHRGVWDVCGGRFHTPAGR
jgi:micrococcal nuclease